MEEKEFTERIRASLFNHLADRIMEAGAPDDVDVLTVKVLKDIYAGPVAAIPIETLHPEISKETKKDIMFFVGVAVDTIAPVIGKVHAGKMKAGSVDFGKALDDAEKGIIDCMEEPP